MELTRTWAKQLSGVSLVVPVIPAAILAALAALLFAGGLGRLGDLGQAVSGPQIPAAPATGRTTSATARLLGLGAGRRPVAGRAPSPGGPNASRAAVRTSGAPSPQGVAGQQGSGRYQLGGFGSGRPVGGVSNPTGGPGGPGGGGGGPGGPGGGSGGPGGAVRAVADTAVKAASSVTSRIPGPVGPVATGVVNSAGGTVDRVLSSPLLSGSAGPGHGLP
jgi:hypothetical protein